MNFLSETAIGLNLDPMAFVENLQYMGIGMLVIFVIIGVIALTTALIGFLMFGNLIRECGVLDSLSETAQ